MQGTLGMLPQPIPPTQPVKATNNKRILPPDTITSHMELLNLVYDELDKTDIVETLDSYYTTGRKGFSNRVMVRAVATLYVLGLPYMNDLINNLKGSEELRAACGFETMPVRTTFNRFLTKIADYEHIIDDAIGRIVDNLHNQLPDLGKRVALDSTAVMTYSNPNRKVVSDPEARWGYKNSAKSKGGKPEMFFGYKAHMISDVTYGIPLAVTSGPNGGNDFQWLPTMVNKAQMNFKWFEPEVVIADRGYDSKKNYTFLWQQGIHPIIKNRNMAKDKNKNGKDRKNKRLYQGMYDVDGVPHCPERVKMNFVRTDPKRGHFYQCPHCSNHIWVDPMQDIRRFGTIRRASDQWKSIYRERYGVERPFKSMKQHRRLEHHTTRGEKKIHMHILLSTLLFLVTIAVNLENRPFPYLVWTVPHIA